MFTSEKVAAFDRNHWQHIIGMGGRVWVGLSKKMRSCIKLIYEGENAQNTEDDKLGYVLLVGDVDAGNSGLPTSYNHIYNYQDDTYPSDYYFSCLTEEENDEYDITGDLFIGRMAVDNNSTTGVTELHNLVEKTIFYEHEYGFGNWRKNIMFSNGNTAPEDYLESDYYPFIQDIIDDEDLNIVNWYELNGIIKERTKNALNAGSFLMTFLGHGSALCWQSDDGGMDIQYLQDSLKNIGRFPVVMHKGCETGRLDLSYDCFAEALTTYAADRGFVGYLGAGRSVPGFYFQPIPIPPCMIQSSIPYSIWNDDNYITGEFVLGAKVYNTEDERFSFNYFGDPGMNLMAQGYEITIDVTTPEDASITKEVFVREDVTVTIPEGTNFSFETDGKLIIEEDATLEIEDNVTLSAISGIDSLIVYGDLIVGDSVTFESGSKAEFVIDIRNPDLIESISYATFDDVTLIAYAKALAFLEGTSFEDCYIEFRKTANNQYFLDSCFFVNSPVTAKRHGQVTNRYLGNIEIDGCFFDNDNGSSAIYIDGFPNFQITDNELTYSTGDGISIYYAGLATGTSQEISNNLVEFTGNPAIIDAHGIKAYYSHADIENNHVYDNKTGLACLQRSSLSLKGNSSASTEDQTQRIQNNSDYQVYSDGTSFPYDFEYNSIYDDQASTYYVYRDTTIISGYDIENNYWGSEFDELDNLYPWNAYDHDPEWQPTWGSLKSGDPAQDLFYSAKQNIIDSLYAEAQTDFQEVIEDWPDSKYVKASVKELMGLTHIYGQDYSGLQEYLESIESLFEEEETIQITEYIINWCDVCLENYTEAIDWFEDRIVNPVSYEDSICSIIDLGYIYTLIDEGGNRWSGYTGNLVQHIPDSREAYEKNRELLINLIPQRIEQAQAMDENNLSNKRHLLQVYPNPVNTLATVEYILEKDAIVMVKLHNANGNLVQILFNSEILSGSHSFIWNTNEYANGLYFISLEIDGSPVETQRIVLSK